MAEIKRSSGVRVTVPDTYEVADGRRRSGSRGTRRGRPTGPIRLDSAAPEGFGNDDLIAGLADQLELVDVVPLSPTVEAAEPSGRRRGTRGPTPSTSPIAFNLAVEPDESAIVLVEQDGLYSWVIGETDTPDPSPTRRRGRRDTGAAKKTVRFTVDVHPSSTKARRTSRRGFVTDLVLRPIKAFVFKFAATIVVGQLVARFERDLQQGLVRIKGHDPSAWSKLPQTSALRLPKDRTPRVLLLVHGTFSSTRGGFGAMGVTDWGRDFLDAAYSSYDAVLGFDHLTLSEDPVENAEKLRDALEPLTRERPIDVDVITHSRGALVIRSLIEHVQPATGLDAVFERVVLVAGPNSGTQLAKPDNWRTFIDLYTNIAVAGTRALSIFVPPAATVAAIIREVLSGVAVFAKALAVTAVDENQVPGLAAMEPGGRFVTDLNLTQPGQPGPGAFGLYVMSSNFETDGLSGPDELPVKLKRALADRLVDQLMHQTNDLVVDVPSMSRIDPHVGGFVRDELDFGTNDRVYHTNYFIIEATFTALRRWLRLEEEPDEVVGQDVSAEVVRDFLQVDSRMTVGDIRDAIRENDRDFVVMRRFDSGYGEVFYYGFTGYELTAVLDGIPPELKIDQLGLLHETQSSGDESPGGFVGFSTRDGDQPWSRRIVVRDSSGVLGVIPHRDEAARDDSAEEYSDVCMASPDPAPAPRRPRRTRGGRSTVLRGGGSTRHRASRGGAGSGRPATSPDQDKVEQHFRAEMDDEVVKGKTAQLLVEVSAGKLREAVGTGQAGGTTKVDPFKKISVTVIPRTGFKVVGEAQAEIDPAAPGRDEMLMFKVKATVAGGGEVWVVAQQGPRALVTLKVHPEVVAEASGRTANPTVADAGATLGETVEKRHQLSIYESRQGDNAVQYIYDFRSKNLDVTSYATSKVIKNREAYLAKLYENIEDGWLDSGADAEEFTQKLRAFGAQLFHELVPAELRKLLWTHRSKIDSIEVVSTEPFVPWEMVHLTEPGSKKLPGNEEWFLGSMGMVRWLHGAGASPTRLRIRPDKAVAVVPEYPPGSEYELEEAADEFEFVENLFGATRAEAQPKAFRKLISKPGSFDLLHYAGHGFAEPADIANAELMLEGNVSDGEWTPSYFTSTEVEGFCDLQQEDGGRPIVVLNACQAGRAGYKLTGIGGFSQAFLKGRAGAFVSSMWSVGDEPARYFTEALYKALDKGDRLAIAVKKARKAARKAGDGTWLAYVVYGDPFATLERPD